MVFDENVAQKKENETEQEENTSQRQLVPTEHLENKENWDPEMGVFVGGTRFSTPVGGKKKSGTGRRPLGEIKVPVYPNCGVRTRSEAVSERPAFVHLAPRSELSWHPSTLTLLRSP